MSTSYGELSQRKRQSNGDSRSARQVMAGTEANSQALVARSNATSRPQYANKIEMVQAMEAAAFSGDIETFKSFLANDVYYRVGNVREVHGPKAVADYVSKLTAEITLDDIKISGAWELGDVVILEFKMGGFHHATNRQIRYPCIDIFRFRGDKIHDWRVFAIDPLFII